MREEVTGESRRALTAYAAGVNAFLQGHLKARPPEFLILGVQPEAWSKRNSNSRFVKGSTRAFGCFISAPTVRYWQLLPLDRLQGMCARLAQRASESLRTSA